MIRSVIPFLVLALSALPSAQAAIVTMDFEGVVPADDSIAILGAGGIYDEDGIRLIHNSLGSGGSAIFGKDASINNSGGLTLESAVFSWCGVSFFDCENDSMWLTQVNGEAFNLVSMDVGRVSYIDGIGPVTVVGTLASGGTVSTELAIVENVLTTFTFGSEWQGLTSVEIYGSTRFGSADYDVGLDNIVVNTVPIPAGAWLFGSALAGLGWLRRRA